MLKHSAPQVKEGTFFSSCHSHQLCLVQCCAASCDYGARRWLISKSSDLEHLDMLETIVISETRRDEDSIF